MKREHLTERLELCLPPTWNERLEAVAAQEATTKSAIARAAIIERLREYADEAAPAAA